MAFRKILVACDFSDPSFRAIGQARDLAEKLGAELHAVHVHAEPFDGRADLDAAPWPTPDQTDRYLRFLEEELRRTLDLVAPHLAERTHQHLLRGAPARRVVECAKEVGADLICVGSTGKGAGERLFLGSVSQSLLQTSPVPVMVVH